MLLSLTLLRKGKCKAVKDFNLGNPSPARAIKRHRCHGKKPVAPQKRCRQTELSKSTGQPVGAHQTMPMAANRIYTALPLGAFIERIVDDGVKLA